MIKVMLALLVAMFSFTAYANDSIELDKDTVVIRGQFDGKMAGKFIMDVTRTQGDEVVVFIDSPGGSIQSLLQMTSFMKASGKTFKCIASFAASAASALLNACDERLIMSHTTLMFHQAAYGLQGSEGQILSRQKSISAMINDLEKINADRMGLIVKDYKTLVVNDLWLYGKSGIEAGAADKIINVTCDKELFNLRVKTQLTFFIFKINVEYSGCPLITYPVSINGKEQLAQVKKKDRQTVNSYIMPGMDYIKWARDNDFPLMQFN